MKTQAFLNMKNCIYMGFLVLIVSMTSMIPSGESQGNEKKIPESKIDVSPAFYKGMITIKLKEGVGEYSRQNRNVIFNIPSLDKKVIKFNVHLLEKRFRYNQEKMKRSPVDLSRIYRIEFPESIPVTKVSREFSNDPNIEYAEPVPIIRFPAIPNDPEYINQDYLEQILADSAWDIHKGENGPDTILIGVVDTGTEWDHEDLVDNVWQNMGEDIDGDGKTIEFTGSEWIFDPDDENGVDDDQNGYVDDFIGWHFDLSSNNPYPIAGLSKWWHGTLMAGIASATTNNSIGVSSITWNIKHMPIQNGTYLGVFHGYDAIIYAAENGADVITNSWGNYDIYSEAHKEAIDYAINLGSIIIAAASNEDVFRLFYPASYPGVINVAAVGPNDNKAGFSNFGPNISICAPGTSIRTIDVNNSYCYSGGTSSATPIVAGLCALVKSYHPDWSSDQVIKQVLGTADPIDQLNPDYINQLGTGRINAYRALLEDEDSVTLQQEIALDLMSADFQDNDQNHLLEPGDTVYLDIMLRNYNFGVGADNSTISLSCDNQDIILLNNTCSYDIPPDDYFKLDSIFYFVISGAAQSQIAQFDILTTATKDITWGDTLSFNLIVAPNGILVYQGTGWGNVYSGDFISESLTDMGYQVMYTTEFPPSLLGFDAVFLSYGNCGPGLTDGNRITQDMSHIITEYLYEGGKLYVENGTFVSDHSYYEYTNTTEILNLTGLDTALYTAIANPVSLLSGLNGSICDGLVFEDSDQSPVNYIEVMTPATNGTAAFEEDEYGIVAVQAEGEYMQKTFIFSYALSYLEDGDFPNTRQELLRRIIQDLFGIFPIGTEEWDIENKTIIAYPNPFTTSTTLSFRLSKPENVQFTVYNVQSQIVFSVQERQVAGEQQIRWNAEGLPAGMYYYRMVAGKQIGSGKLVVLGSRL